jgi:C1A family cysteine protease
MKSAEITINNENKRKIVLGWKPDLTDYRDHMFKAVLNKPAPPLIDLRSKCPIIYDQGELGSCTANALAGAFQFELLKQIRIRSKTMIPSRLFIYYNERVLEGTVSSDSGASLRDGIKTLNNDGVCSENLWKYKISRFIQKPSAACYANALKNQVQEYISLPASIPQVKQCLVDGFPVVFGFTVYTSFLSEQVARTGIMPMPQDNDQLEGGHAVMAVGYDNSKSALIVRNSWGKDWGINGYFYMPYDYTTLAHLTSDFWSIRLVENGS